MTMDVNVVKNQDKLAQARRKQLKSVERSEEPEVSSWSTPLSAPL